MKTDAQAKPLVSVTSCRECGSKGLVWSTHNQSDSMVPEGRLRSSEVKCLFVLGCESCSETLAILSADSVAAYLTGVGASTAPGAN